MRLSILSMKRLRDSDASSSGSSREDELADDVVVVESEDDEEPDRVSPPKRMRRRASIFPGSIAYNEAILASFEAVILEDLASPNASPSPPDEDDSHDSDNSGKKIHEPKRTSSSDSSS